MAKTEDEPTPAEETRGDSEVLQFVRYELVSPGGRELQTFDPTHITIQEIADDPGLSSFADFIWGITADNTRRAYFLVDDPDDTTTGKPGNLEDLLNKRESF